MITPRHVLQLISALGVSLALAGVGGIIYHGCIKSWAHWESYSTSPRDFTLDRLLADKFLFLGAVGLALLAARIMLGYQWRGETTAPAHEPATALPLHADASLGPDST
jgi:hypothetical protein